MIEAEGLSKRFGSTQALAGVDLEVPERTVLALLGPNGAGKTTLVRILTTLLKPDAGRARVAGYDVVADAAPLRSAIGLAGQYAAVDDRFSLQEAGDRLVKTYSGGMRRRLDIGASLIARPRVVFLDEPTSGLDPPTRNELWQFVEELVAGGATVLLTTQYMEEAERLADRIVVLDAGSVIA